MKILLAEDTEEIANNLCEFIKTYGHEVDLAENGVKAKNFLRKYDYDLIICDHNMPRACGHEVYEYLRNEKNKSTKFIHFSSAPCPELYKNSGSDENFVNCFKLDILKLLERLLEDVSEAS